MDTTRASLLIRIRDRNNSDAWRQFDAIYRPMILRFARSRGASEADAEDVVQHCLTAIQKHAESFEYDPRRGRFRGWLCTLACNRVRNLHRAERRREAGPVESTPAESTETPEQAFERVWLEEHLRHCLAVVEREESSGSMKAFRLYAIDERPVEEVCSATGLNAGQLYKLKWRITRRLAELMADLEGDDDRPTGS